MSSPRLGGASRRRRGAADRRKLRRSVVEFDDVGDDVVQHVDVPTDAVDHCGFSGTAPRLAPQIWPSTSMYIMSYAVSRFPGSSSQASAGRLHARGPPGTSLKSTSVRTSSHRQTKFWKYGADYAFARRRMRRTRPGDASGAREATHVQLSPYFARADRAARLEGRARLRLAPWKGV